jgi:hypothetical protein
MRLAESWQEQMAVGSNGSVESSGGVWDNVGVRMSNRDDFALVVEMNDANSVKSNDTSYLTMVKQIGLGSSVAVSANESLLSVTPVARN